MIYKIIRKDLSMTFSEKLKKLRREKGITQNELADAIFISRSMIAKY